MNPAQRRRRLAEEAADRPVPAGLGFYIAGGRLTMFGKSWPRGAVLPASVIEAIPPARMDVLRKNLLVVWRPGAPPAAAPQPIPVKVEDPKAVAAAQKASLESAGFQPWELDHKIPAPPGAHIRTVHPSAMIKPSRPISQGGSND